MDEGIFSFFLENFGINIGIAVIIISTILFLVISLPRFMDSITYFQSRKIKHINEALDSEYVNEHYKKILSENINRIHLNRSLGLKLTSTKAEEIIKIYEFLQGNFNTIQIYRAIDKLPKDIYSLHIDEIKKIKVKFKSHRRRIWLFTNTFFVGFVIIFLLFFYHSVLAFNNHSFFTYEYLITGGRYGSISLIFLFISISLLLTDNIYFNANRIIDYIIDNSE